jgi:TolB-like protein
MITALWLVLGLAAGCAPRAAQDAYVRRDVDFSYVKRVALLPFENLSADKTAGEKVRKMMACELLASGLVDIAGLGETSAAYERLRLESAFALKAEDAKTLCQALGVQALLFGTIARHEEVKAGSLTVPEVAITFNMIDESGTTLWSSNVVTSGGGFFSNYLGGRGESVTEVSLRAIRNAIRTLRH